MSPRHTARHKTTKTSSPNAKASGAGGGSAGSLGVLQLTRLGNLTKVAKLSGLGWVLASGAVGVGVSCALVASTLTPVYAAPVNTAAVLRAGTLAAAQEAARAATLKVPFVAPTVLDGQGPVKDQEPVGDGEIKPGQESEITAEDVGAHVTFSGHEIDKDLKVEVKELQDGAGRTAAAETGGVALNSAVEITATNPDGKDVTSFPADPTILETPDGPDVVTAVDPGVALELAIDESRLGTTVGKIDPASIRIMTRETPGEAWVELPSYYDKATGKVKGESDHLSQFVVIGTPFVPPAGPKIVLDPDDDVANTVGPNGAMTELPQNMRLANDLKTMLTDVCQADVAITRDASLRFVSPETRAAIAAAHNPVLTVTIAFDALNARPWGVEVDGGTKVYSRGGAEDNAITGSLVSVMPAYTGRPAKPASQAGLPYPGLSSLPGALTHLETLYIDHNYDRPVIDNGFTSITNGVFTGLGQYLQTKGFNCLNPVTGGWPAKPSAAELAKWKNLGFHNFQAYGADPVSFTTGNLIEKHTLFTLTGPGNQALDLSLVYNSQDGRLSRAGAGVSFGAGARVQRFSDGSVLAVRGDGASYVFTGNGAGGYTAEAGTLNTLTEAAGGQLQLASPDGETWLFDTSDVEGIGELTRHTDRQGNTTTLTYGGPNDTQQFLPLASITDAAGQTVTVGSDSLGRITSFTHPDGRIWGLAYDAAGNLASITEPDGRTRVFTYDGAHQLLTATDALGILYLKNEYDAAGRVAKQWDAEGTERSFIYDDAAKTTTYVDNEGNKTVYTRDDTYRVTKILDAAGSTQDFSYDTNNQVTSYTDQNGVTTAYAYDGAGHLTQIVAREGDTRSFTYTPAGDLATSTDLGGPDGATRTTTLDYDPRGLPVTVHHPDGTTTTNTFDAAGNLASSTDQAGNTTTYTYDSRGNLTTATDPLGRVTAWAYDAANRATSVTDPNGNTTAYAWDTADRLTTQTDAAGGVTTLGYDGNNHLVSSTDPLGAVTTYEWDALWRVKAVTAPDGGRTEYAYNREDELTKVTNPLGAVTGFDLDPLYRVTKATDPLGGAWARTYDRAGNLLTSTDPENGTTTNTYDQQNRLLTSTDPTGAVTTTTYDTVGRTTTVTDPEGGKTSVEYDVMDRVIRTTDQAGNSATVTYDAVGNPVTATDRRGQVWLSVFDAAGQLISTTDPTGATSKYAYDRNGNPIAATDPLGRTTTAAYDAVNRPITVTNPDGETSTTSYDPLGRVMSSTDGEGDAWANAYDIAGRLTQSTDPDGVTTSYAWDKAGNQTATTDTKGTTTAYTWDPAQQLTAVTENQITGANPGNDTNVTTSYSYTPAGHLATVKTPNGNTTTFTHDQAGRTIGETNPAGNTWSYDYDGRGLLTKQKDANGNSTTSNYTPTGDLATTTNAKGVTVSYGYDPEQHLITMADTIGASAWEYDARGALTSQTDALGKKLFYDYDKAGQLTTLTLPAGNTSPATGVTAGQGTAGTAVGISYTYDLAGRIAEQNSPWGSLDYTYTEAGRTASIERSNGVTTTTNYTPADRVQNITHTTQRPAVGAAAAAGPATAKTAAATTAAVLAPKAPVSQEAKACTTASSYLKARTLPENGATGTNCIKTADYLNRRTLPSTAAGITPGEALTLDYTYDPNGNVATRTRTNGTTPTATTTATAGVGGATVKVPNAGPSNPATGALVGTTDARTYAYDPLNRLTGTTSSTGVASTYAYDANGNRTNWSTADNPSTTTAGDALNVAASYNNVDQLTTETRTGSGPVTTAYGYDRNGNRTNTTAAGGPSTGYTYTPENQTATITRPGLESSYAYDGLGRNLTTTDTTEHGTHETSTAFNGLEPIQNTDTHGTANLIPDNLGRTALQTGTTTEDRWALLDKLGSTIAQATTTTDGGPGAITELSEYTDYGVQEYATTGWDSDPNYTGQPTNTTHTTHRFHSRTLDPATGTWTGQDKWRGLLTQPQTLNRYNYVTNNPTTLTDYHGYWGIDFGAIGRGIGDTFNNVVNFVGGAVQGFMDWSNGLSEGIAKLPFWSPTPAPKMIQTPTGPMAAPPQEWSEVDSTGTAYSNNSVTGGPMNTDYNTRLQVTVGYWGSFLPVGRVLSPAERLLAGVAQPGGKVAATHIATGFADNAVGSAYQGMRSQGGHAIRHLRDEGLIVNSGSLASQVAEFERLTSPILRTPAKTFDWRLGDTMTRAFMGQAGGRTVVVFVAKEGAYDGRVLSAVVPDAGQMLQWGAP